MFTVRKAVAQHIEKINVIEITSKSFSGIKPVHNSPNEHHHCSSNPKFLIVFFLLLFFAARIF